MPGAPAINARVWVYHAADWLVQAVPEPQHRVVSQFLQALGPASKHGTVPPSSKHLHDQAVVRLQGGSLRVAARTQRQKISAATAKKYARQQQGARSVLAGGRSAVSGLSSSLAFTPVQVCAACFTSGPLPWGLTCMGPCGADGPVCACQTRALTEHERIMWSCAEGVLQVVVLWLPRSGRLKGCRML